MSVNDWQIGGDHYARGGSVQHWDFVSLNGLSYLEGCATKYIARWRRKHGINDLKKAQHYVQKMIELYQTGRLDCPRRLSTGPLPVPVVVFTRANELGPEEHDLTMALTFWEGADRLQWVVDELQVMIDREVR